MLLTGNLYSVYDGYSVKNLVRGIIVVILLAALGIGGYYLYLLGNKRGVEIPLGSSKLQFGYQGAFFPSEFEQSFTVPDPTSGNIRKPKFERNTLFISELQGDIKAKDIDTGQEELFSWNDNAHYICIGPADAKLRVASVSADPVKNMKNYVFFNIGTTVAGVSAPDIGYYMFLRDVEQGTPVKFILENETLNSDGGLNILEAIVFTKHAKCATANDVIPDLRPE